MAKLKFPGVNMQKYTKHSINNKITYGWIVDAKLPSSFALVSKHFAAKTVVLCDQIHANNIGLINNIRGSQTALSTDGLITRQRKVPLIVFTADCVPITFTDINTAVVGIAHAGWKGTLNNISLHAVRKILAQGSRTENIQVILGPHIGVNCYQVSAERASLFTTVFKTDKIITKKNSKYFLNLALCNEIQLTQIGIPHKNIKISSLCTHCKTYLPSFRRSLKTGEKSIQMCSFVMLN